MILDEPSNGLDPIGQVEMQRLITQLGQGGRTILLSSHDMREVEELCGRAADVQFHDPHPGGGSRLARCLALSSNRAARSTASAAASWAGLTCQATSRLSSAMTAATMRA